MNDIVTKELLWFVAGDDQKKRIYTTHLPHFQSTLKKQGKSFLSLCLHTMHACTHKQEVRQGYEYNLKTLKLI